MNHTKLPLQLENSYESLYGNFGQRFAALLLDGVVLLPITLFALFLNGSNVQNYYYITPATQIITLLYYVYLPVHFGATPGKLMMGLRILKIDGTAIGYQESFLKYVPAMVLSLMSVAILFIGIGQADTDLYNEMGWVKKQNYLQSFASPWHFLPAFLSSAYVFANLLVFLLTDRNRSIGDFLARTVVVKNHFIEEIDELVAQNAVVEQAR
jgi:uncharacterized RDD family membrane protein YckC